ncbi:guanitoxin biosynthesis heme-dependent pre-guanitoxin N-hydroxylase GntA [Salinimicrobium sp. GXAS 041]|uniref:guanitoxin biosynthesis heme-dependent pre-guanitoxin N-hydroxylase GntA n=1 Tax=Salinimicrobium sp. GXAS 041 TaxID=3400806 RepID=UPI003C76AB37
MTSGNQILTQAPPREEEMESQFEDFIIAGNHPCVMAQSVFTQKQVDFHAYGEIGTPAAAGEILEDLKSYLSKYDFSSNDFFTFVAAFRNTEKMSEEEFEQKLWQQLQYIHEIDEAAWDEEVSPEADSKNFSFSIAGKAFYLVGMHPGSSRMARQSPFPVMVFNLHWQFEKLREMGAYGNVRNKIRERDFELQGNNNPMLEDFGEKSEARQYSGRAVGEKWKCPFHHK